MSQLFLNRSVELESFEVKVKSILVMNEKKKKKKKNNTHKI